MAARTIAIRIVVQSENSAAAIDKVNSAVDRLNKTTGEGSHLQNGLTNSFIKGNLAARGISATYLMVRDSIRMVVSEVVTFDFEMAKISAILEVSGAQFDKLDASIRSVAVANRLGHTELAKTALEMGKVGLSAQEVQNSIEGVARLARALDENLVTTGETVASVIRAYGFEAAEANRITEQLAYTVKSSALDIEQFRVAFSYVGGTAKMAGISFEELQASMQVLSNSGIRASTIGTQLRKVILTLSNDASLASKVLGGKTLQDFDSLTDALVALGQAGLKSHDYFKLFGATAASVAPILVRQAELMRLQKENTEAANNSLGGMADRINDTYLGSWQNLTGAIKGLGISLGELTEGPIKGFLNWFAEIPKAMDEAISKQRIFKELLANWGNAVRETKGRSPSFREVQAETPRLRELAEKKYKDMLPQAGDLALVANMSSKLGDLLNATQAFNLAKSTDSEKSFASSIGINPAKIELYNDLYEAAKRSGKLLEFNNTLLAEQFKLEQEARNAVKEEGEDSAVERLAKEAELNKIIESQNAKTLAYYEALTYWLIKVGEFDRIGVRSEFNPQQPEAFKPPEFSSKLDLSEFGGSKDGDGKDTQQELQRRLKLAQTLEEVQIQAVLLKTVMVDLGNSSEQVGYQFGESMVSALTGGGNAFKEFNTLFGDIAKNIIANISAMIVKFLVFRAIAGALGLATGGMGFTGGSTLANLALTGLGGTQTKATGGETTVNQPTWFLAGEEGPESVRVTPRAKASSQSSSSITVVIQGDVMDGNKFQEAIELAQRRMNRRHV